MGGWENGKMEDIGNLSYGWVGGKMEIMKIWKTISAGGLAN